MQPRTQSCDQMSHWLTLLTPTTMITIIIQGEWNDYYCAVCNDGGEIIACDGVCLRRSVTSLPFIVPVVSACRLGPVWCLPAGWVQLCLPAGWVQLCLPVGWVQGTAVIFARGDVCGSFHLRCLKPCDRPAADDDEPWYPSCYHSLLPDNNHEPGESMGLLPYEA